MKIQWGWLTFLAVQLGISILYLAITMRLTYSYNVQVLKSSSLATMLALEASTQAGIGKITSIDEAKKIAKTTSTKLMQEELVASDAAVGGEKRSRSLPETGGSPTGTPIV